MPEFLTVDQLREALEQFDNEHALAEDVADALYVGAHLALTVLEHGEEMEWCEEHDSLVSWGGMCGHSNRFDTPCRTVPSLRIPSAVFGPAKNEEEK